MLEMEIKARCGDPVDLERRLAGRGARSLGKRNESDLYFNHPSRDFASTDEALRVRVENGEAVITYKGPKLEGRSKSRYEAETAIGNPDVARDIFLRLGFSEVRRVQKERALYDLDGVTVCLDRVMGLGDFVEIEIIGEDREAAEKELFRIAGELGIMDFERRSYLEMLLEKGRRESE